MTSKNAITRRNFLRIVGVGGVAGLATALKLDVNRASESATVTETRLLMGTVVNLTLITDDRAAGQLAIQACLDHMETLEGVLSRHKQDSELSRLNREGTLNQPDAHLVYVLREALYLSSLTDGAFDVTVKPLADLYHQSQRNNSSVPASNAVHTTLARVGYQNLMVNNDVVSFARPAMSITLDGIAKGYIVDQGINVLQEHGFSNILVEAGGDLSSSGTKTDGAHWRVGIQQPRQSASQLMHTFNIHNQAVATSGDYMQSYTDDYRLHHIIDPRLGYSSSELASATVVGATGLQTDALATALMVLGVDHGLQLVESLPEYEALLVTKDMRVFRSTHFVN